MKYAMDVKVNVKPVFSNLVHSDWWEGPCRVGPQEQGTPEFERRVGREQFEVWKQELDERLDKSRCCILEPAYLEFDERFVMRDSELEKLVPDNHKVDLYLLTYRVPGIERLGKPISMINLGPTPIDLVAYYRDLGMDAYMAHDYDEYNHILTNLQVKKAVQNTKILILSNCEQTPASVNTSCPDLVGLFTRYGIRNNRIDFHRILPYFDAVEADATLQAEADTLLREAVKADVGRQDLLQDLRLFHAVRRMMEDYDCNAFTIPCKELCASRIPQKYHFVPCMTHSLNKDDRIPSACEEDLAVWMAMTVMMYLTRQSVFMGNPVLVPQGSKAPQQLGMPNLLTQAGQVFDHDVLEIHHAVPARRMKGFDEAPQPYELGHFTTQGWGAHYQIDMNENSGQTVTFGRFNRAGTRMMVAVGHTLGCEFRPFYCSPAVYYDVEGGARAFRQALAKGGYGHHQAVVYGDQVQALCDLGEIMGFEVDVFR